MSKRVGFSILAAGQGTRMKINTPKPLAPICGKKLIDFPLWCAQRFCTEQSLNSLFGVVVGHGKELVMDHLRGAENLHFPVQEQQLGTADALKAYFEGTPGAKETDYTVVLCADTPLIRPHHLEAMFEQLESENLDGVVAAFTAENPKGYGRIVGNSSSTGFQIIEEKDASDEEKSIDLVNSGLYMLRTEFVLKHLYNIGSENKSGEFYLTDLFQKDTKVKVASFEKESDFLGVNDLVQLHRASRLVYKEVAEDHLLKGVIIVDRDHTYIEVGVKIAPEVIIYPNNHLMGDTEIGEGCILEPGCMIKNSKVSSGSHIKAYSYFENAIVGNDCVIGPFARLREGSNIGPENKIGNFVETKKVEFDKGVKVSHLSYVGDAEIGENVNIGCGFITCNYDGANKHKTKIGKNTFIGSDSQMIAPINIGEEAYVGSGSTINQDVPDGAFAIARGRQVTKEGMAKRFIKKK